MKVTETDLPGCLVVEPRLHADARGSLYEAFHRDKLAEYGVATQFAQVNVTRSVRDVLRGLHYQWPHPQGKYVSVLHGEIWDVAVDIRRGSPTFGRWTAAVLSADNRRHFWVPPGFAHGFAVLSEDALVHYLCSEIYDAEADAGIRWNDARLAIDWPIAEPVLSAKDRTAPLLEEIPEARLPAFAA